MKTWILQLVASAVLGITLTCCGQGSVRFENYDFGATSLNAPVTLNGIGLGKEFSADLLYSLDGGASFNVLTAAQENSPTYPTPFALGIGSDGDAANDAGYFFGEVVTIPGYSSGPVTFIVQVYRGSSYATADLSGQSAPFTLSSIATGTDEPSHFDGMQAFDLAPEPSVFALGGLGAAGLIAFRRKKS